MKKKKITHVHSSRKKRYLGQKNWVTQKKWDTPYLNIWSMFRGEKGDTQISSYKKRTPFMCDTNFVRSSNTKNTHNLAHTWRNRSENPVEISYQLVQNQPHPWQTFKAQTCRGKNRCFKVPLATNKQPLWVSHPHL